MVDIGKEREFATLAEARAWLMGRVDKGGDICPCCDQWAEEYERLINAGMARGMIAMYDAGGTDWVHVPSVTSRRSREESKLKYWGLVIDQLTVRPDGGHAGWWKVTEKGERYLKKELRVPKYALVYDNELRGFKGELLGIEDALGMPFDLRDVRGKH